MNTKTALLATFTTLLSTAAIGCGASQPSRYVGYAGGIEREPSTQSASDGYDAPVAGTSGGNLATSNDASMPPPASARVGARDDATAARGEQARSDGDPFELQRPQRRPGLATRWGEQRRSQVSSAPFVRAERTAPFALAKLFYNDAQGVREMAERFGGVRYNLRHFAIAGGYLDVALRDGGGRFITGFQAGGNNYLPASNGDRYTIVIQNHSPGRVEAVVSVDGLDVIDGTAASPSKRGYLLDPYGDLEIEGFRTSTSEVAAFRFGAVGRSYAAQKHGNTRNVGVIGVALFHERGDSPDRWPPPGHRDDARRHRDDARRRHDANPFPRFATP